MTPDPVSSAAPFAAALEQALAHPALERLAGILKVDLSDAARRNAIVALAQSRLAAPGGDPPLLAAAAAAAPAPRITAYYVKRVLQSYADVAKL